jgi:GNAT superfamily N-acetyltransferase
MTVLIRPGSDATDQATAIALFASHLNPAYNAERFDWLYRRNPAGPGRLWLAVDAGTGEVVGTAGAFPRVFNVGGRDVLCWALGDFCVTDRYRALGPALKLQRACLEPTEGHGAGFCYDFPSQAMMTVYRRLGIAPTAQVRRFVKLLRLGDKLDVLTPFRPLNRSIGWLLDAILAVRTRSGRVAQGLALALHEGTCGEEFSRLAESESSRYGICVKRTASYVDWRFRTNPLEPHHIVTARREGRLVAYAVFTCGVHGATVVDLFGTPAADVLRALVRRVATIARRRGSTSLSVSLLESDPWVEMFARLGFVPRESTPFVMAAGAGQLPQGVAPGTRVFVMYGDRDS